MFYTINAETSETPITSAALATKEVLLGADAFAVTLHDSGVIAVQKVGETEHFEVTLADLILGLTET